MNNMQVKQKEDMMNYYNKNSETTRITEYKKFKVITVSQEYCDCKKEVVENMKVKAQLNEVYDSMDDLKNVTATDKLLDSIKEKNDDLNASVAGARTIHENKTSTKIQRANEEAKKLQSDDYLESLKKKYNK